ncbi:hypothetical protein J4H86_09950 [Spiractinospora alimapuensis]|uniref:hypothetical protein n=1 Tax=Spiractinospora alimapuensis TaxID=2820884 RepID=UPI001F1886FB|nr:hypothetical protein [Spiractinospora alimapuensis]QVQ53993.1 hypothetical protein J4H86_09950 [Spiractinospora alimapuensis]
MSMLSDSGDGPLSGVGDIDWRGRVGDGGEQVPELLAELHHSEDPLEASYALAELLNYPAPGHVAAPGVVSYLVRIATDAATVRPYDVLALLHEFAAGRPGDAIPRPRDVQLWRDEVAWVSGHTVDEATDRYRTWIAEAPTEQRHRRHTTQLKALTTGGGALVAAELATHDAIRERIPRLMRLVHDPVLRNREYVPQEAANLFSLFPEEASRLVPLLRAYERLSDIPDEDLPSALFAIGVLSDESDARALELLESKVFDADDATSIAAAVGQVHVFGTKVPEHTTEVLLPHLAAPDLDEIFPSPYADVDDHTHLMLTAGLLGERARGAKADAFGTLCAVWDAEVDATLLVTDALEFALGPRSQASGDVAPDSVDAHGRQALAAVATLSPQAWEHSQVSELAAAWGLPAERDAYVPLFGSDGSEGWVRDGGSGE